MTHTISQSFLILSVVSVVWFEMTNVPLLWQSTHSLATCLVSIRQQLIDTKYCVDDGETQRPIRGTEAQNKTQKRERIESWEDGSSLLLNLETFRSFAPTFGHFGACCEVCMEGVRECKILLIDRVGFHSTHSRLFCRRSRSALLFLCK